MRKSPTKLTFRPLVGEVGLGATSLLMGIERRDLPTNYWGAIVVRDRSDDGSRIVRVRRGGIGERILAEEGRLPVLNQGHFRYELPFAPEVYASWRDAGILRPRLLDKILVCPKCGDLPTFRFACVKCGSGRVKRSVLAHHFACAWVGPVESFGEKESLICPKCRTRHLIAGTDFEYAPGEHHCQDCRWKSNETQQTGHCLQCDTRFPLHQALENDIEGYDVV